MFKPRTRWNLRVAGCLILTAAAARAEQQFVVIEHTNLNPGVTRQEYLAFEKRFRPFHEHKSKTGQTAGWALYEVEGTHDRGFVIIRRFTSVAARDSYYADLEQVLARTHPNVPMKTMTDEAHRLRTTRTEKWTLLDRVPGSGKGQFVSTSTMEINAGSTRAEYLDLERRFRPVHEYKAKAAQLASFSLYEVESGGGKQFAIVQEHNSDSERSSYFADLEQVLAKTHPRTTKQAVVDEAHRIRKSAGAKWLLLDRIP